MPESNVGSVIEELYDREGDVYYVNFGTGEPSYCVEVDDEIVVEVGLYSKLPTGYRLLNRSQLRTERRPVSDIKERLLAALRALPKQDDRQEAAG